MKWQKRGVIKANAIQSGKLSRRKAFKAKKDFLALLLNVAGTQRAGT
jgi:hypothetical protein